MRVDTRYDWLVPRRARSESTALRRAEGLRLHDEEGLGPTAIAAKLGISVGLAGMDLTRARRTVSKHDRN